MQHSARAGRRSTVRAARRLAVLLPLVCALGALVSCSKQEEALTTPCGLVIDGSGSAAAAKEGFDSEAKLKDTLGGFLTDQKCGTLDFAPVTRSSRSSSCRPRFRASWRRSRSPRSPMTSGSRLVCAAPAAGPGRVPVPGWAVRPVNGR